MTEYGRIHTDGSRSCGQPIVKTQHCPNCEATEQKLHDFRQEVSDAMEQVPTKDWDVHPILWRFIIPKPKPDPLVEVLEKMGWYIAPNGPTDAENFRATLEARGFEIREKNDG